MTAEKVIEDLQLLPHSEDGYFKQVHGNDE